MTTWLHEERLRAVENAVQARQATTVLDLGCGDGDMIVRLAASDTIRRLVGLDICRTSLTRLRHRLAQVAVLVPDLEVIEGSMTAPPEGLAGFDCALLVETIEHIPPTLLSQLENAVFRRLQPKSAIITTPNAEFNALLGVPVTRFRHPDHQFEWNRAKFRGWADRVAAMAGYHVQVQDIGGIHPEYGGASQMAVFSKAHP